MYESEAGRLFYRDVKGVSEDEYDEPVYTLDNSDDDFYTWMVQLEELVPASGQWYYRDIMDTPTDPADDELYAVDLPGAVPGAKSWISERPLSRS